MVALGLLLLAAAGVTAVVGVLTNDGTRHALDRSFEIFGWTVNGSTGRLFAYGVIVGAVGVAGLMLLLAGLSRRLRVRSEQRRNLRGQRQEAESLAAERDELASRLEHERTSQQVVPTTATGAHPTAAVDDTAGHVAGPQARTGLLSRFGRH